MMSLVIPVWKLTGGRMMEKRSYRISKVWKSLDEGYESLITHRTFTSGSVVPKGGFGGSSHHDKNELAIHMQYLSILGHWPSYNFLRAKQKRNGTQFPPF